MNPLKKYHFPKAVNERISPIGTVLEKGDLISAENRIAELALEVCGAIETGQLTPEQGNDYFMLIDMFLTDNFPAIQLRQEIQNIIFEGLLLHDYGTAFGANLQNMQKWAKAVLDGENERI